MVQRVLIGAVACAAVLLAAAPASSGEEAVDFKSLILEQFVRHDPRYLERRATYRSRLDALSERIDAAAANGNTLHCSQQMYLEARWLSRYTARWVELDDKIARIEKTLDDPEQAFATRQSPVDGLWGLCYRAAFMRLAETVVELDILAAEGAAPRYRIRPQEGTTGREVIRQMQDLLISDIAADGIDRRGHLGSLVTTLSQSAFKPHVRDLLASELALGAEISPASLHEAFRFFLQSAQDPDTGYWGAWYIVDGKVHRSIDLSMTYHVIRYKKGDVQFWPQIVETTLAVRDDPYPYGWRSDGRFTNHNLYDVATIFRYGWPHMDEATRQKVRAAMEEMLVWSLRNTVAADGSFRSNPAYSDSLADDYYFGVSFLDVAGYWDEERRFWTDAPIDPELAGIAACCPIRERIAALGLSGWAAEGAAEKLKRTCAVC